MNLRLNFGKSTVAKVLMDCKSAVIKKEEKKTVNFYNDSTSLSRETFY